MNPSIQFKMTVPTVRNSVRHSPIRRVLLLIPLVFVCFGLSPAARAVLPAPDGGYLGANTAEGDFALFSLPIPFIFGFGNTAIGFNALRSNTFGNYNTATGHDALFNNTIGGYNTATGVEALISNTEGNDNTATGHDTLNNNTTDNNNIALGSAAGFNLTTGDNNIDIGNEGVTGEANTIRIGRRPSRIFPQGQTATFIAGIIGVAVAGPVVHINSSGQLGVPPSSARFKQNTKPMDKASEAILALKPVTFRYKKEIDPDALPQFGLVAEDVAKVNPDLVARDAEGKVYTVRYEAVNAMLLNEFLKEHRKVEKLEAALELVNKRLKEQDAKIQKVSAELETRKPGPQVVENSQR